jgi:hypothetical protein
MNTPTIRLNRFSAAAGAMMITAVSAWAFVNSTASIERDPFRFAAIMVTNAKANSAQPAGPHVDYLSREVRVYGRTGLLAPFPLCLTGCS